MRPAICAELQKYSVQCFLKDSCIFRWKLCTKKHCRKGLNIVWQTAFSQQNSRIICPKEKRTDRKMQVNTIRQEKPEWPAGRGAAVRTAC